MSHIHAAQTIGAEGVPLQHLSPFTIEAAGVSHVGKMRDNNEDAFALVPELGLFLVADGMGGLAAGEVAAKTAIEAVRQSLLDPDNVTWPGIVTPRPPLGLPLLTAAIQRANARVFGTASRQEPSKQQMGTTIAAMLAVGERVYLAHVGDSRIYRLRGRRLDLMTEDHSLVNVLIRAGQLSPDEADAYPNKHIIVQAIGTSETVKIDTRTDLACAGDVFLLCSDGLSNMVDHQEMATILLAHTNIQETADRLVERANANGGHDNITAVVVRWSENTR